jgi:hypothetical protein
MIIFEYLREHGCVLKGTELARSLSLLFEIQSRDETGSVSVVLHIDPKFPCQKKLSMLRHDNWFA